MPAKRTRADQEATALPNNETEMAIAETRWQDRPLLSLQLASELASISVASLYRAAEERRLSLRRLLGRTLVETSSFIKLMNSAEPWTPSDRGKEARAKRSKRS